MYIFGGFNGETKNNNLHCYDTISNEWRKIVTDDIPPTPRDCHSCVIKDASIYIFGGNCGYNFVNDFYEYRISSNSWHEIISSDSTSRPTPRHSHIAAIYENYMIVFGGIDSQKPRNDLYLFNFRSNKWTEIKSKENDVWPKPRYNSLVTVKGSRMYLYGGNNGKHTYTDLLYLDLNTFKWAQIDYIQDEVS